MESSLSQIETVPPPTLSPPLTGTAVTPPRGKRVPSPSPPPYEVMQPHPL